MKLEKLFDINCSSQEFNESPQLVREGQNMILKYDYEKETGEYGWNGITFQDVVTCKITKMVCEELYIIQAYDSVAIVRESDWIKDVAKSYKGSDLNSFNHYAIHFEDYGSYEFIAKSTHDGIILH